MSSTAAPARSIRRTLSRRVLRSSLAGALTTPHGVDRYVELRAPVLRRSTRSAGRGARRPAPDGRHRHHRHPPQRQLARLPRRPVRPRRGRDRRRAPHALLLDGRLAARRPRRASSSRSRPTRDGLVCALPADHAQAAAWWSACRRPTATSCCPTRAAGPAAARQRRQRHHAGDVDAAHAAATRATTVRSPSCTTPAPTAVVYADELAGDRRRAPERPGGACPAPAPRHRRPRRPVPAVEQLDAIDPGERPRRRATYVCGPAGLIDAVRERVGASRARAAASTSSASPRSLPTAPADDDAAGEVSFARSAASRSPTTAARCSSRPRPPASHPDHGCRMGICHTCTRPQALRHACATPSPASSHGPRRGGRASICVSAPVGDVALDL